MNGSEIYKRLKRHFGKKAGEFKETAGGPLVELGPEGLREVMTHLRRERDLNFDSLMCLSGVDKGEKLAVVYHLCSTPFNVKLTVRAVIDRENPTIPTVEDLWPCANWHEREAYDMFGVNFEGHSDLRRILCPDDWEGHTLRKDYEDPEGYGGISHHRPKPWEEGS